jgi:CRISPR-associated endonuclease Cas2
MFDVPEDIRRIRSMIRRLLKSIGFEQLQRSVWYGNVGIEKELREYMDKLGAIKYVKIFRATDYI